MNIKPSALLLALLLSGAPSWASTVESFDLVVRYEGTGYRNVEIWDNSLSTVYQGPHLRPGEDTWGLPDLLPVSQIGSEFTFTATATIPDNIEWNYDDPAFPYNNATVTCSFAGALPCDPNWAETGLKLGKGTSYVWDTVDGVRADGTLTYATVTDDYQLWDNAAQGLSAYYRDPYAAFTIVSQAPVLLPDRMAPMTSTPVPLSAALLPAALGMMAAVSRRRRKKAS
ncbi:hypothetical protein [Paracoccus sp. (in: a-proteobacteria)]|uniref:hypothetical protein n=1 Tax=Paracoccus sp. TaxID=267 RepID=UPI003A83E086